MSLCVYQHIVLLQHAIHVLIYGSSMLTTSEQGGGRWGWPRHSKVCIHFSRWWEMEMVSLGRW